MQKYEPNCIMNILGLW